ncbi:LysR family transcriptional regulator [Jannaschia ovalis]|uniref:LysR family transcriptional regulator n=1 Tax=Jannaschia ovalis TaxID=3038773 RepID=A0ABY8LCA9_9RHOB|nr:LysR family transcriptional regulator [Jannaschia sp. GRR-S6-38]WGH78257.1 LysR family transcriptional regulator [Jannaschia sp. GRR-S6-38]
MDWDDLRIFLSVARAGSLTEAARGLRLDPATLSRRVRRLEAAAGAALFVKSPQGYALTGAGQGLMPHAEAMEAGARAGRAALSGPAKLAGRVRIGAPDGIGSHVLPQVCAGLRRDHPDLAFDIVALPRLLDLSRREADMAITVSAPAAGRLIVRRICDYRLGLAAHRDWLAAHGPVTRDSLRDADRVGYIPDMIFDPDLDHLGELGLGAPDLASNSANLQWALIRAGAGVGVVHDFMRAADPAVVPVLPEAGLSRAFHLVRHADTTGAPFDAVADLLAERIRVEIARLEARAAAA